MEADRPEKIDAGHEGLGEPKRVPLVEEWAIDIRLLIPIFRTADEEKSMDDVLISTAMSSGMRDMKKMLKRQTQLTFGSILAVGISAIMIISVLKGNGATP